MPFNLDLKRKWVVLHICHASGVAGSGSVTYVSRKWCRWLW
jgi:hypothetical protein